MKTLIVRIEGQHGEVVVKGQYDLTLQKVCIAVAQRQMIQLNNYYLSIPSRYIRPKGRSIEDRIKDGMNMYYVRTVGDLDGDNIAMTLRKN